MNPTAGRPYRNNWWEVDEIEGKQRLNPNRDVPYGSQQYGHNVGLGMMPHNPFIPYSVGRIRSNPPYWRSSSYDSGKNNVSDDSRVSYHGTYDSDLDNSWKNWGKRGADLAFHEGWWKPRADILETQDTYRIEFEVPGILPDNINLKLDGDILTLRSNKPMTQKEEGAIYYQNERHFGQFYRRLLLPEVCDASRIHASLTNGILSVSLHKNDNGSNLPIDDGTNRNENRNDKQGETKERSDQSHGQTGQASANIMPTR